MGKCVFNDRWLEEDFKIGCRDFLVAMVKKLLSKAPITYPLVRLMSWMDPVNVASPQEKE